MQYDFDQIIDRSNNYAAKYDERMKKFGTRGVLPLWVADMDFKVAQPIIDALISRAQQGIFGYTFRPDSYFEAICDWQERRNGWRIDRSLINFSVGVVPAISAIIHQFTQEGDKVLIQTPVYPEFESSIRAWNREVLVNQLPERDGVYSVDFERFEDALRQRPRLFILCSPHNPVGKVWTRDELLQMCGLCVKHGVRIISDEIHSDLLLWGNRHIPTATLSDEIAAATITCTSGTKTFNLAGLQASTNVFPNVADKEHYDDFWKKLDIHRNNCFSLVAIEAAFRHGEEWLTQLLAYLEGNVRFVHEACKRAIPKVKAGLPESTYLVWLDCRELGLNDAELADFMVKKARLGMNSGIAFGPGGEGYMRLNAACPRSVLQQAMEQLHDAVNAL